MITLYFVRHGETEWNVENRVQGQLDSPLTDKGIKDVLQLKHRIQETEWQAVFSSPIHRALYTAKLLCDGEQLIYQDKRLMEMNLGIFQSMTWKEIKQYDPTQYRHYWHKPALFSVNHGETFLAVRHRVEQFLQNIQQTYKEGNILIVTHGVIIKIVQLIAQHISLSEVWATPHVKGATVTRLFYHDLIHKWEIIEIGV